MSLPRRARWPAAVGLLSASLGLGLACVALAACSSGSVSQQTGYPTSGGGPLGAAAGGDDGSTGSQTPTPPPTGGGGDNASSGTTEAGSSPVGDGGASDAAPGAGIGEGGVADGAVTAVTFTLLNATVTNVVQGSPVPGYDPIAPGSTISLAAVGTSLSVRANTTPALVGSVEFILDANYTHTENATPYTLCGDNGAGAITACPQLAAGQHTLAATEFTQQNLGGTNEGTATISFTITP